jgi:hypothetical protein
MAGLTRPSRVSGVVLDGRLKDGHDGVGLLVGRQKKILAG